jgi:hypothetical protein
MGERDKLATLREFYAKTDVRIRAEEFHVCCYVSNRGVI